MMETFPVPRLEFPRPLMNAAGSLGFAPDPHGAISFDAFGAFVTNPISERARRAAKPPVLIPFPGGVLLHTGYPNPGLSRAIRSYAGAWARAPLPVIVHLLADTAEETRKAILRLEDLENLTAIEIGFQADSSLDLVTDLIQAAAGELPVIAHLPLTRALDLAETAISAGASAISIGPPRGALAALSGSLVSGRLYGPALFPQALGTVRTLSAAGVSVIGAGGVEGEAQVEAMLVAGAMAVQMDVGLWKGISNS